MKYSSVLVVTYGRSGSTLLQGLLNSIDGCLVRGENYNFCFGLFTAWESLRRAVVSYGKAPNSASPTSPWFGAHLLDADRFIEDARRLVMQQLCPPGETVPACIGFKEIRYLGEDLRGAGRLSAFLDFLGSLFPNPAIIVLTRPHHEVVQSAWWRDRDPGQLTQQLAAFESAARAYAGRSANAFLLDYADMTQRTPRLRELFEFLGAAFDPAAAEAVLATPHSYNPDEVRKKAAQRAEADSGVDVEFVDAELVEHFQIDRAPQRAGGAAGTTGGILLLKPGLDPGEYDLRVQGAQGELTVNWGLPSPRIVRRFPTHPHAAYARFRIERGEPHDNDNLVFQLGRRGAEPNVILRCIQRAPAET